MLSSFPGLLYPLSRHSRLSSDPTTLSILSKIIPILFYVSRRIPPIAMTTLAEVLHTQSFKQYAFQALIRPYNAFGPLKIIPVLSYVSRRIPTTAMIAFAEGPHAQSFKQYEAAHHNKILSWYKTQPCAIFERRQKTHCMSEVRQGAL